MDMIIIIPDYARSTARYESATVRFLHDGKLRKWRKTIHVFCFQVRYAPKVSLSKIDRIVEGSELRFKCCAEANPPDVEYR